MNIIIFNISNKLNKGAEYLLMLLMITISLLIFTQVIFRYVFNYSLYWSEELGRYTLIWITFLGASVGFKRKAHVGVDFLYNAFNNRAKMFLTILTDILLLGLSLILCIYGTRLAKFVHIQTSAALLIPMSIPFASIAVGGFLTSVHSFSSLIDNISNLKNRRRK